MGHIVDVVLEKERDSDHPRTRHDKVVHPLTVE
jgi:hypothetical protein